MTSLPETTKHRLQRLPQIPHVWEGDRRSITGMMENLEPDLVDSGECIIWVDGSEGFVRSMDVMRSKSGPEAMVRALLKAIENPHSPAIPARPQKIVVKDRQLQFFLRGALQGLDIIVDYQPELPLLDELWQNFQNMHTESDENISPELSKALEKVAISEIWKQQPWQSLSEEEIIKIDVNQWGVESLYACVMGMLGEEFGIILYRSLDSMKTFRQQVMSLTESEEEGELEATFLQQDCWFINFSHDDDDESLNWNEFLKSKVKPIFGSIHPYEGISPLKDEEEVYPIYAALKAFGKFVNEFEEELSEENIDLIEKEYDVEIPLKDFNLKINVSTTPEITKELEHLFGDDDDEDFFDDDDDDDDLAISDELIPEGALISLGKIESSLFNSLQNKSLANIDANTFGKITRNQALKAGFPVIIVQTTRPKAQIIIEKLKDENGIVYLTFNKGYDPYEEEHFDLSILQTKEENLYILAQFEETNQKDSFSQQLKLWQKDVAKFNGYCGVVIAMGASGASRGQPQHKDFLYLFYGEVVKKEKLGLETLVLSLDY
ncbi:MAG: hypothetical protein GW856_00080 [Cyanobacteria bacterium]|nr:hypothetical protein [Cyanobacteria bacterium CG_2015-16_32_12]NCO79593.1 hypothetical protein [Cyanobacteria bacterium CG_2015-22_32_23]NCQ03196.1 hypothetical protein [Cyanobacteria bacterium CG_2015-09_32_10]NCS84656.1 hypothetical protein [Cyanobacteria bacterium CG_2015-02_32_10]